MAPKTVWALALTLSVASLSSAELAFAAAAPQEFQPGKLEQIIPGHYAYSNGARISGIIATSEGVVVLDALSNETMAKTSNPRMSRDALMRARAVLVNFRDSVQREIMRGATEEQTVAAVQLPEYRNMVGYDQQRAVLVRRMYQDLKGQVR